MSDYCEKSNAFACGANLANDLVATSLVIGEEGADIDYGYLSLRHWISCIVENFRDQFGGLVNVIIAMSSAKMRAYFAVLVPKQLGY